MFEINCNYWASDALIIVVFLRKHENKVRLWKHRVVGTLSGHQIEPSVIRILINGTPEIFRWPDALVIEPHEQQNYGFRLYFLLVNFIIVSNLLKIVVPLKCLSGGLVPPTNLKCLLEGSESASQVPLRRFRKCLSSVFQTFRCLSEGSEELKNP